MTIRCDICGEECNTLFIASIILTSMVGGLTSFAFFTERMGLHLIGMLLGLSFGLYYIYSQNKKHFNHVLKLNQHNKKD